MGWLSAGAAAASWGWLWAGTAAAAALALSSSTVSCSGEASCSGPTGEVQTCSVFRSADAVSAGGWAGFGGPAFALARGQAAFAAAGSSQPAFAVAGSFGVGWEPDTSFGHGGGADLIGCSPSSGGGAASLTGVAGTFAGVPLRERFLDEREHRFGESCAGDDAFSGGGGSSGVVKSYFGCFGGGGGGRTRGRFAGQSRAGRGMCSPGI